MENDKKSVKVIVDFLINANIFRCYQLLKLYKRDYLYIINRYKCDTIDEEMLLKLIRKSKNVRAIRWFIPDIISLTNENSFTTDIIEYCINYKGNFKKTLLSQLSHKWLRTEHLKRISCFIDTPEAFCKLFVYYVNDNEHSVDELNALLFANVDYIDEIRYLAQSTINEQTDVEKKNAIEKFIHLHRERRDEI